MTQIDESTTVSRLAIIGCGMMGEAILAGIIDAGTVPLHNIVVTHPDAVRRDHLWSTYGVKSFADNIDALPADVVILAVKPQVIDSVASELAPHLAGSLVVSIAVGVSCERLETLIGHDVPVVRVMPNTPALIGEGISVVSGGSRSTTAQVGVVSDLFGAVGRTVVLAERHQDAAAAISGSGPAYFELIVDSLARAGVRHGLPRAVAQELAVATMSGTARLIDGSDEHPQALIDKVTSPGGTTIAAIEAMEAFGIRTAIAEGVAAAIARAEELR